MTRLSYQKRRRLARVTQKRGSGMRDRVWAAIMGLLAGALSAGFVSYFGSEGVLSRLASIEAHLLEHGKLLETITEHLLGGK